MCQERIASLAIELENLLKEAQEKHPSMSPPSRLLSWIRRASIPRDISLVFISALAGLLTTHLYYVRSLDDMESVAQERHRVEDLVLRGIETIGTLRYARDTEGKITGVSIDLKGHAVVSDSASGDLTVGNMSAKE